VEIIYPGHRDGPSTGAEWPDRERRAAHRTPVPSPLRTYLLDADDDLAAEFDLRTRPSVRQGTTVRVLEAEVGECDLERSLESTSDGFGLLVLDGLIALETHVGDRTAVELLAAGDMLQPDVRRIDAMLPYTASWRVLQVTRFAVLDAEFASRIAPWPQVVRALLRRAGRRAANVDAIRAITSHPRLEVRLDLLFWHLAPRWGRVEPTGIRLTLPLTHRLLGQLVAAERPSISHALARLDHAGLVTGAPGDWHLHGSPDEHLDALIERGDRLAAAGQSHQIR
jgi:CRP/FNR family transcriptional regulator, cyclic AMP receptor protein